MEGTSLLILISFLLERAIWIWRKKERVWHKNLLILISFLLERVIWIWRKEERVWHKIIELKGVVVWVLLVTWLGEREMEGTSWSLLILISFLLERAIWIWRKEERVWHKIIELELKFFLFLDTKDIEQSGNVTGFALESASRFSSRLR